MSTDKTSFISRAVAFIPQVRQEVAKVTWPTRRETLLTTAFVFVLAMIAAVYFTIVDQIALKIVSFIIGIV
jgi:preprotein translocase subunit SecE